MSDRKILDDSAREAKHAGGWFGFVLAFVVWLLLLLALAWWLA